MIARQDWQIEAKNLTVEHNIKFTCFTSIFDKALRASVSIVELVVYIATYKKEIEKGDRETDNTSLVPSSYTLGSLRSYDGRCTENDTLKYNFSLGEVFLRIFHVCHVIRTRRIGKWEVRLA